MSYSYRSKWKRRETLWDIIIVSPQFIIYFVLTIVPFFVALPIMFTNQVTLVDTSVKFIGFQNFVSIFKSPIVEEFLPSLWKTVVFTALNYLTMWLFGMSLALLMYEISTGIQKAFFTIIYLPYIVSGLGIGMMVMMLLSKDTGSLNLILLKLGILKHPIDIKQPSISI